MTTIVTINGTDTDHLASVIEAMRTLGAPVIRCVRDETQGILVALEGSHRLMAAKMLGLAPVLAILDDDATFTCEDIGYDDMGWFDGEPTTAGAIRNRLASPMGMYAGCEFLDFEEALEYRLGDAAKVGTTQDAASLDVLVPLPDDFERPGEDQISNPGAWACGGMDPHSRLIAFPVGYQDGSATYICMDTPNARQGEILVLGTVTRPADVAALWMGDTGLSDYEAHGNYPKSDVYDLLERILCGAAA